MNTRWLVPLLALPILTACPATAAAPEPEPTITVKLSGIGEQVTYTCPQDGKITTCHETLGSRPGVLGTFNRTVTVPVGTMVRVAALADILAWCQITDDTGRLKLDEDHTDGQCSAEAR